MHRTHRYSVKTEKKKSNSDDKLHIRPLQCTKKMKKK